MNISVIFVLLLSFTEQVKAIYCFNALVCISIIMWLRLYEDNAVSPVFFLLWPLIFCLPFTLPVFSSPVFRFALISSLLKAHFGSLIKARYCSLVSVWGMLRETGWVLPPQLLSDAGALWARLRLLDALRGALFVCFFGSQECVLHLKGCARCGKTLAY